MNKASRTKDESKIKFYGPFASALGFIIHCGNKKHTDFDSNFMVYRGLQVPKEQVNTDYVIGSTMNLLGFTSTSLIKERAIEFALEGFTKQAA